MAEPTIQNIFGANATQSATQLVVSKQDLAAVGLTASANNTPESILVAIVKIASLFLREANQQTNPEQNVVISSGIPSLQSRNGLIYRQDEFTIELQKLQPSSEIDPDDY